MASPGGDPPGARTCEVPHDMSRSFPRLLGRAARPLLLGVLLLTIAACSSGDGAGWTYAPAPSSTPAGSSGASGEPTPSGDASQAPSGSQPAPSIDATPTASGEGVVVTVVATSPLRWDTPELTAPAQQEFTLVFDNQDSSAPHNVVIQGPGGTLVDIGDTTPFTGPGQREYTVPPLDPGEYPFICQVHPTAMVGTLTVG
jgi:plastocyanin